jgi:beta-barrel assembly-enhancing protease
MTARLSTLRYGSVLTALVAVTALAVAPAAQTQLSLDRNKYSTADDVRLGREAADGIRKELPMLDDRQVHDWVNGIGRTLVAALPQEFRHDGFNYTFEVVNQQEINAFALPGGPMFLNRGMIEAAGSEGEMAGVMAHEIAHVALRHGTAQATRATPFQLGALAGQIGGALLGGTLGNIIGNAVPAGLGTYFLRYGREYEREADTLGAQILARAGYQPREMANMFRTIEKEGGRGGPEWLSSHPNPGNRYEAINREAETLRVQGNGNTGRFAAMQQRLRNMPPAPTAEEIARRRQQGSNQPSAQPAVRVPAPASQVRTHEPERGLRVSVPRNWSIAEQGSGRITYTPDGAFYRARGGQTAFTHGVQIGTAAAATGNLQQDTERLLASLARSNPQLRRQEGFSRERLSGRAALRTTLSNVSSVTGAREQVTLATTYLPDGRLFYVVGVVPQEDARDYERTFRRVRESVQISGTQARAR